MVGSWSRGARGSCSTRSSARAGSRPPRSRTFEPTSPSSCGGWSPRRFGPTALPIRRQRVMNPTSRFVHDPLGQKMFHPDLVCSLVSNEHVRHRGDQHHHVGEPHYLPEPDLKDKGLSRNSIGLLGSVIVAISTVAPVYTLTGALGPTVHEV